MLSWWFLKTTLKQKEWIVFVPFLFMRWGPERERDLLKVTYLTENADLNPDLSGFVLVSLDFKLHEGRDVKKKKKNRAIQTEWFWASACATKVNQTGFWLPLGRKRQLTENYKASIHSKNICSVPTNLLHSYVIGTILGRPWNEL